MRDDLGQLLHYPFRIGQEIAILHLSYALKGGIVPVREFVELDAGSIGKLFLSIVQTHAASLSRAIEPGSYEGDQGS